MRINHNIEPQVPTEPVTFLKCTGCGRRFAEQSSLTLEILIQYGCPQCDGPLIKEVFK